MSDLPTMQTIIVDGNTKYTIAYPLTRADGKPILDRNRQPKITNLVADTVEELVQKMAQANIEAARSLHNANVKIETLSRATPAPAPAPAKMEATPLTDEQKVQTGLELQDPRKAADAVKRVVESVVPTGQLVAEAQRQAREVELARRRGIAREFITAHQDTYWPCEANNAMLNRFLEERKLEFSVENLEFAAAALQSKLAQHAPQNEPSPSPQNEPTHNAPPNRGTPPPPPARAPVGGIRNTTGTVAPAGTTLPYSKDDLLKMAIKQDPKWLAILQDPVKYAMANQILAGR